MSTDALTALRALGDETRLAMARLLAEGAFNVGEVQAVLGLGQSTASRNLKILADAGIVECRREGRIAWYRFSDSAEPVVNALRALVSDEVPLLDEDGRRRLHETYEARTERSLRHFAAPDAPAPGHERVVHRANVVEQISASLPTSGLVADLGTGTGRFLPVLAGHARRVVGVDASPRMLEAARAALGGRGRAVDLRLGTLEHLPFADGELDAALLNEVLHHAAQPGAVLSEVRRVLRPGGRLVVADYLPHELEWMREELADQWLGFEPRAVAKLLVRAGFTVADEHLAPATADRLGMFVLAADRRAENLDSKNDAASRGRGAKVMPRASNGARRVRA